MLFLVSNNGILLIIISGHFQKIFGQSKSLRLEICYYTCPAGECEHSISKFNHFFLILISITCHIQVINYNTIYINGETIISAFR